MMSRYYFLLVIIIAKLVACNAFNFFNGNEDGGHSSCDWRRCYDTYVTQKSGSDITRVYRCLYIVQGLNCLSDETPNCIGVDRLDLNGARRELNNDHNTFNCSDFTNPTPTISSSPMQTTIITPTSTPLTCSNKLPNKIVSSQPAPNAHYKPALSLVNVLCDPHHHNALRQCSMFTDSHVRHFDGSFQTCTLPGSWYLLHHPDVTIEVTGGTKNASSVYTNIDKINITLSSKPCTFGAIFNYVAKTGQELPTSLHSSNPSVKALYQPLEFHLDSTKTTASILAPWLNLTVIIRKHDNYLSVVLRMPADLIEQSEGICRTGCPSHTQYSIIRQTSNHCLGDQINATKACSNDASLISPPLPVELSTHLLQMCIIDILSANSYYPILSYKGIVKDYLALPSVGVYVVPEPNHNIINIQTTTNTISSSSPIISTQSSSPIISTQSSLMINTLTVSSSSLSLSSTISTTSTSSFFTSTTSIVPSVRATPQSNEVTDDLHATSSSTAPTLTLTSASIVTLILFSCLCINFL